MSSDSKVELCRFIPSSAAHCPVARVPEPHQSRSARPGDCGWTVRPPLTRVRAGSVLATTVSLIAARNCLVLRRAGADRFGHLDILPRLKGGGFQLPRRWDQQVRFAVHKPGILVASPRSHGVPRLSAPGAAVIVDHRYPHRAGKYPQ